MFDDPKQRLYELEQALKAAQWEEEEEALWLRETQALFEEEEEEPEEMTESDAVYVVTPRRKGALPYVLLALLELAALGFLLVRWLQWTL